MSMSLPVTVRQENGEFVARLFGDDNHKATGATADEAMERLTPVAHRLANAGELRRIDVPIPLHFTRRVWTEEEREHMREVVAEIYRERDAQKAAEFPD